MSGEMQQFVVHALETRGAIAEQIGAGTYDVVLPEPLAEQLELDEAATLSFGEGSADQAVTVSYGTETLNRMLDLARSEGLTAQWALPVDHLRSSGFDDLVQEQVQWTGAKSEFVEAEECAVSYLILNLHHTAISDERREGLRTVLLNERTLWSSPELLAQLGAVTSGQEERSLGSPAPRPAKDCFAKATRLVQPLILKELQPFEASMNRRLARDLKRITDYYEGIQRELRSRIRRRKLVGEEKETQLAKLEAAGRDLEHKKQDLLEKYSIRINVKLTSACRVWIPAVRCACKVTRRTTSKTVSFYWNPVLRELEGRSCDACLENARAFTVCDSMHFTCRYCHYPCESCGKKICKKCLPKGCPNCK